MDRDEGKDVDGSALLLSVRRLRRGEVELLARCAAGADVHPTQPHVVLLFGGYCVSTATGGDSSGAARHASQAAGAPHSAGSAGVVGSVGSPAVEFVHCNDIVSINTRT